MNRNRVLWGVQGLLAALFVFFGGAKLVTPVEMLAAMFPFPGEFIQFIGICEVLGALGLLLPGITGIRRELTVLAAVGLTIIMVGATVSTLAIGGGTMAAMPAVLGLLTAAVAYGRRQALTPLRFGAPAQQVQPAS